MEITEVRIKLMENPEDRLRGFCSVTFDGAFVVRDLKIIEGNNGPFVAMPSRKLTGNCRKCRSKNHLKANYCNQCGSKVQQERVPHDSSGRAKLYADIAHPINAECREMIQRRIVEELKNEQKLAREPGYRSRYDEGYDEGRQVPRPHKKRDETISSTAVRRNVVQPEQPQVSDQAKVGESSGDEIKPDANAGVSDSGGKSSGVAEGPSGASLTAGTVKAVDGFGSERTSGASISNATMGSIAKSQVRDVTDSGDSFGKGVFDV